MASGVQLQISLKEMFSVILFMQNADRKTSAYATKWNRKTKQRIPNNYEIMYFIIPSQDWIVACGIFLSVFCSNDLNESLATKLQLC